MPSIVRPWIGNLSAREQGSLFCAMRNCDLTPKLPLDAIERRITAALRFAVCFPADEREVDSEPGCFMISQVPHPETVKVSHLAHYPVHFVQKLMLACEVLGYRHIDGNQRAHWKQLYQKIAHGFHLNPETLEQYEARMNEDRIATGTVVS